MILKHNLIKEFPMKIVLSLAVLALLVACGGPKTTTITIEPNGNQMAYMQTEFTVKAGQEVVLIMNNTATVPVMKHNIVILNDESKVQEVGTQALSAPNNLPDHPAIIAATPMADAGAQTQVKFTAPTQAGKYIYICTYPGHYAMMKGYMIVE